MAFVPFLALIRRCARWSAAFGWGYLVGWLFWVGTIWWVGHVTIVGMLALVSYLAFYHALFGVAVWLYVKHFGQVPWVLWLGIPTDWVILEWIRSWIFSGFGWNLLAYSQWQVLPVIQIADLVGAWGVSWLVMWVNVTVDGMRRQWLPKEAATLAMVGMAAVLGFGLMELSEPVTGRPLRVAVVQGNIPQAQKWDAAYEEMILGRYTELTRQAAREESALIIWPETSVPGYLTTDPRFREWVGGLAREARTPLLVGAPRQAEGQFYNSAVLIDQEGEIETVHDKLHLVPFGEFIPFERLWPWLRDRLPTAGDFSPGVTFTLVPLPRVSEKVPGTFLGARADEKSARHFFAVLICFEDVFPGLVRRFVRDGAQFLVVITNDAWFGRSGAADQHAAASVFRAVEHRVPVVRAANTGYSCIIDPYGRITTEVRKGDQRAFVSGFAVGTIPIRGTQYLSQGN